MVTKQDITNMKVYRLQSLPAHPHFTLHPFHGQWQFLYFCPFLNIPYPSKLAIAHVLSIVLTGNQTSRSSLLPQGVFYALMEDRGAFL